MPTQHPYPTELEFASDTAAPRPLATPSHDTNAQSHHITSRHPATQRGELSHGRHRASNSQWSMQGNSVASASQQGRASTDRNQSSPRGSTHRYCSMANNGQSIRLRTCEGEGNTDQSGESSSDKDDDENEDDDEDDDDDENEDGDDDDEEGEEE